MLPNRDTMKISRRISEVPMSGIRKMFDLAGPDSINLGLGEPDLAPPSEAIEGMNKAASAGLNKYGPTAGIPELRDAVVETGRMIRMEPLTPLVLMEASSIAIAFS